MLMGIIADDLTGASDIAGFVAKEGLDVIQFAGVPKADSAPSCDAAVISLKTRSALPGKAVRESLAALEWLRKRGCERFYFKYCSTFDSTPRGNIGPVADAILDALGLDFTVVCPSLPVNRRTVRDGILYVDGVPLAESGMRFHPLNPMTESDLTALMEAQSRGRAGVVRLGDIAKGAGPVAARLAELRASGVRYAVLDAETDAELDVLAGVLVDFGLATGGSGLGGALARALAFRDPGRKASGRSGPHAGKTAILSGSCSETTNRQTAAYRLRAPEFRVEAGKCLTDPETYAAAAAEWAAARAVDGCAPMIAATVNPGELGAIQERHGAEEAAEAVERFFRLLAPLLYKEGFVNLIVAGGETSGAVAGALGVEAFRIGPEIAPGVSWVFAMDRDLSLAMKSGNFGDEQFFVKALELIRGE